MVTKNEQLYNIIGEMLRERRIGKGMTLDQIADKLGVTPKTIQRYECGERKIQFDSLITITDVLGVDYGLIMRNAQVRLSGGDCKTEDYVTEPEGMSRSLLVNPDLQILFDASEKLSKKDIDFVISIANRLKTESS